MRRVIFLLTMMAATLVVAGGVALAVNKVGTQDRDFLKGTDGADNLLGKGGNDLVFGLAGKDNLLGGSGKDIVFGGTFERALGGDKNVVGGPGNDVVAGGKGSDKVVGGGGNDLLIGGEYHHPVKDTLSGGGGNDVFFVDNDPAGKDVVTCGGGFDRVFADREDVVAADCEKVADRYSEFEEVYNSIPQSFWDGLPPPIGPQYPSKPQDYAKAAGLAKDFEKANINPIIGDWRRKRTCEEYVSRLRQAGLTDQIQSHRKLLAEFGAGDADGGEDSDGPCRGVNGHLAHDHIFYRDGLFRSVDNNGNFVDFGNYRLPDDHTIVFPKHNESIPPVTAHFRFSDHLNTVTFYLVLPKNLDECSEKCREVYANAVQVFFSGLPWHRVCQADHKDNDVFGRADQLGEACWVDPMAIEDRLD